MHALRLGLMAAENALERQADLTDGRFGARRLDRQGQEIGAATSPIGQGLKLALDLGIVALGLESIELFDLPFAHGGVVDLEGGDLVQLVMAEPVDPDHRLLAGVDPGLGAGGGLFDPALRQAGLDGLGHAAHGLDLGDVGARLIRQVPGQAFDRGRAAPGVDRAGDSALELQQELGVPCDAGREIGRQGDGFVERIGVQRLGPAEDRGHGFDGGAGDVIENVLGREAPAGGLAMAPQHGRARVLGRELGHKLRPDQPPGPELGDLGQGVHADAPEEAQPGREGVDVQARPDASAHIFDAIGQGVGELQFRRRAGLLHMVARYRDRVEPRHLLGAPGEDVSHDPERWSRRIDVGVAHHELFQDVVLDRS